jgi:hypothetical protein
MSDYRFFSDKAAGIVHSLPIVDSEQMTAGQILETISNVGR